MNQCPQKIARPHTLKKETEIENKCYKNNKTVNQSVICISIFKKQNSFESNKLVILEHLLEGEA